jgi:hypothetical protein
MIKLLLAILLICLICAIGVPAWIITTLKVIGIGILALLIIGLVIYFCGCW